MEPSTRKHRRLCHNKFVVPVEERQPSPAPHPLSGNTEKGRTPPPPPKKSIFIRTTTFILKLHFSRFLFLTAEERGK